MKSILIVAIDFPPSGSPGVYRTLALAKSLLRKGYKPIVITVPEKKCLKLDRSLLIPASMADNVFRPFTLDAQKDLSLFGKYFECQVTPDRWWLWQYFAIRNGRKIVNRNKPALIWSTYPYISAHVVAMKLKEEFGISWIADYRDPLSYHYSDSHLCPAKRNIVIDEKIIKKADKVVFATKQAKAFYSHMYSDEAESKWNIIENGYDEHNELITTSHTEIIKPDQFLLLHSGGLFVPGRDPLPIFKALAQIKARKIIRADTFRLRFRGSDDGRRFESVIKELNIKDLVEFAKSVTFVDSLKEMAEANALLILQDAIYNMQIPTKAYEYLKSGKPLLAVTPKDGATAAMLNQHQLCYTSTEPDQLVQYIEALLDNSSARRNVNSIQHLSRKSLSDKYVDLLEGVFNA